MLYHNKSIFDHTQKEVDTIYSKMNFQNKVVMDLGAHIGQFTKLAYERGAKQVIAFEPDPITYGMLVKNCAKIGRDTLHFPIIVNNFAVIGTKDLQTTFHIWEGSSQTRNSILSLSKESSTITVNCMNFTDIINMYQPEVLKIDVEGTEYTYEFDIPSVQELMIEWHGSIKPIKGFYVIDKYHSSDTVTVHYGRE